MASETGKKGVLSFGTTWGPADCLQGINVSDSMNRITYMCNEAEASVLGVRSTAITFSMALPVSASTISSYIYPGAASTEFWMAPHGYSSGSFNRLKFSSTKAQCTRADASFPVNGIIALDVELQLDNVTISSATT